MKRLFSFVVFSSVALVGLSTACSSKNDEKTECTSQDYPDLACKKISSCATGKGSSCTSATLKLPDGQTFKCASCSDCVDAQEQATAACNEGAEGSGDAVEPGETESEPPAE